MKEPQPQHVTPENPNSQVSFRGRYLIPQIYCSPGHPVRSSPAGDPVLIYLWYPRGFVWIHLPALSSTPPTLLQIRHENPPLSQQQVRIHTGWHIVQSIDKPRPQLFPHFRCQHRSPRTRSPHSIPGRDDRMPAFLGGAFHSPFPNVAARTALRTSRRAAFAASLFLSST